MAKNKIKLAIVRAIDVRLPHVEFATGFKSIETKFITDKVSLSSDAQAQLKKSNIPYITLHNSNALYIDPVKLLIGRQTHQSWIKFNNQALGNALKGVDILEIYEPYFFYSAQVARIAKKRNIPLITEIWTSFPNHPATFIPPYSFNVNEVIRNTDLFILRCKKALTFLEKYNIPSEKKVVVYQGVNLGRFFPGNAKNSEKIIILFVGALSKNKGLDDILAVFPRLFAKYGNKIELVICGKGPLKDRVLKLTKKYPIRYLGQLLNTELPLIYRDADIFCGPSKEYSTLGIKRWEEFVGYTFMEAMASGLPIISTYCGGISEIIGKDNILIEQGNCEKLFNAIETYIEDSHLRKSVGLRNRKRALKLFDIERQTTFLEKIIIDRFAKKILSI